MRAIAIAAAALLAAPAAAQTQAVVPPAIDVTGHGKVSVPPDTANIHYWLRGEGKTPDDATRAMTEAQARVESGLKAFLGADAQITNSDLLVIEVRDPNCKNQNGQPMLSQGDCAIVGYLAQSQTDVATPKVDKAGTTIGLASRLGARDARFQGFELRNIDAARREAMVRAVNDARAQALVLAGAAGGHLGRARTIQYGTYMTPMGKALPMIAAAPPPPPPAPPPVEIDFKPKPQDITADVSVSYELLP